MTTIQINFRKNDFAYFNKYCIKSLKKNKGLHWKFEIFTFLIWLFIGLSIVIAFDYYMQFDIGDIIKVDLFFIATVIWVSLSIGYDFWGKSVYLSTSVSEKGCTLGEFQITFSNDNIKEEHKNVTSVFSWNTVLKAEKDKNYIFIFIDERRAIIIPIRDISQEQQTDIIAIINNKTFSNLSVQVDSKYDAT